MAWDSKIKIFNLPLFSFGAQPRGIIAIGWISGGIIAIGQFGYGVITIAQFGIGIISLTQMGAGFIVIGQMAIGLIFAFGQLALGFFSIGGGGFGYYGMAFEKNLGEQFREAYYQFLDNPSPLYWWIVLLALLSIYAFSKRSVISTDMSVLDLFRPKIKNSLEHIRLKALALLTNEKKLLEIAIHDPSLEVRVNALNRMGDIKLLVEFIMGEHPEDLKIIALKKIKNENVLMDIFKGGISDSLRMEIINLMTGQKHLADAAAFLQSSKHKTAAMKKISDQNLLLDIILKETDTSIVKMAMGRFTSKDTISRLAREGVSPQARILALEKIDAGNGELLAGIALNDADNTVRMHAAGRIKDPAVLEKIAMEDRDSGVRIAAVNRIADKNILMKIIHAAGDRSVTDAASQRLEKIRPFYNTYMIEMNCPSCSQPVFLNGPVRNIKCSFCLKAVNIKDSVWKRVLNAEFGVSRTDSLNGLIIEKTMDSASCSGCGEPLETDDIPDQSCTDIPCGSCGKGNHSFPVPGWFTWAGSGNHVFCAARETEDSEIDEKMEPVAISCIRCGGPLEITKDTPRNVKCSYCNTIQYLPDPLWISFHPVKTKKSWTIRFNFKEREKVNKELGRFKK